ncbi:MAG: hypothetical protein FJ087_03800 [Deltaproteobacteria bacterium]|nr:hypothetical protein [Deltaproteobacteria bacterium]
MRRSLRRRRVGVVLVAGGVLALIAVACNYHWYPIGTTFQFRGQEGGLEIVSAVPAVKDENGDLVPMCDPSGSPDGLILTMNLLGTEKKDQQSSDPDRDVSMRPGDIVKPSQGGSRFRLEEAREGTPDPTVFPALFEVELRCMEAYPDPNLATCTEVDAGTRVAPAFVRYEGRYAQEGGYYPRPLRETGRMGVSVLVDQSGSMKGYVDRVTDAEVKLDSKAVDLTALKDHGSDPDNVRLSAVREFFQNLNPSEEALVFKFNEQEGGAKAVCANPDNLATEDEIRDQCFGTFRDLIFKEYAGEASAFDKLQAGTDVKGRTPLWASVLDVYEFMKKVRTEVRHVVVIGDGPDTCAADSADLRESVLIASTSSTKPGSVATQAICSAAGYKAVRDAILADIEARKTDPRIPVVHVSFVHFQAQGYRRHDARQQELACLTGGQYVFVNAQDLARDDASALESALKEAMLKIRHTLAGSWKVGVEVPALKDSRVPKGAVLGLDGTFRMSKDNNKLTDDQTDVFLKVWSGSDVGGVNNLDHRLAVRIPCSTDADCAWLGPRLASCSWYDAQIHSCATAVCDDEVKVCRAAEAVDGATCGDEQTCTGKDTCVLGYCGGELASAVKPAGPCAGRKKDQACDDGNVCTTGEKCDADDGNCVGGTPDAAQDGKQCDDGNSCTDATTCTPGTGKCENFTPAKKDNPCETDNNPCTDDKCNDAGTCEHRPLDGGSCSDPSNPCRKDAACAAGVCGGGTVAANLTPCGKAGLCWEGICEQVPGMMKPVPSQCVGK